MSITIMSMICHSVCRKFLDMLKHYKEIQGITHIHSECTIMSLKEQFWTISQIKPYQIASHRSCNTIINFWLSSTVINEHITVTLVRWLNQQLLWWASQSCRWSVIQSATNTFTRWSIQQKCTNKTIGHLQSFTCQLTRTQHSPTFPQRVRLAKVY